MLLITGSLGQGKLNVFYYVVLSHILALTVTLCKFIEYNFNMSIAKVNINNLLIDVLDIDVKIPKPDFLCIDGHIPYCDSTYSRLSCPLHIFHQRG